MKKIAVFLAEGFEEIEAVGSIDILRRAGMEVDIVSAYGDENVRGAHGILIASDKAFSDIDFSKYDILVLPGGMPGTDNLNRHEGLKKLLLQFHSEKKVIAAICAAPLILGELGILEGREAIAYPGFESRLKGATLSDKNVVRNEHIITGKGAGYVFDFAFEILGTFLDEKELSSVKNSFMAMPSEL